MTSTLGRYFGLQFLATVAAVFAGVFVLIALIDYIELMRRNSDVPNLSALMVAQTSLYRVPQVTERIMPFCVLIGAMSCYLGLSRRLELVIARSAGMSAWQFIAPAIVVALLIGVFATTVYNPVAAILQERSKRLEAEMFGRRPAGQRPAALLGAPAQRRRPVVDHQRHDQPRAGRAARQRARASPSTPTASSWSESRPSLRSCTPANGGFGTPALPGRAAPRRTGKLLPEDQSDPRPGRGKASRPRKPCRSGSSPNTSKWLEHAGLTAAGYRLQYQKLLSRPFMLAAMVLLAAAFSLRFFRFGGVQKMVLGGVTAGFLLYVLSKVTDDLSKAELLHPVTAAWLPVLVGGMTGFVALLYQEDG